MEEFIVFAFDVENLRAIASPSLISFPMSADKNRLFDFLIHLTFLGCRNLNPYDLAVSFQPVLES